jgi:pyruvate dehydrogenase E1 component beta subunit
MYAVPIGEAAIRREESDITVVTTSFMASEAEKAGDTLAKEGISVELIDLRTLKPWDKKAVLRSVSKTGRLIVADAAWRTCGVAAEIAAAVAEEGFHSLKAPILRVTLRDAPAPTSAPLERAYYPDAGAIVAAANRSLTY